MISPKKKVNIPREKLDKVLNRGGFAVQSASQFGTTFNFGQEICACILKSGIMIAQTPPEMPEATRVKVFEIYRSIMIDGLGLPPDILPTTD